MGGECDTYRGGTEVVHERGAGYVRLALNSRPEVASDSYVLTINPNT